MDEYKEKHPEKTLVPGIYRAENGDAIHDQYKIDIRVKETEKSYIFILENFDSRYSGAHIEMLFSKSKRVVIKKDKGGHAMRIWSESDFTIYPFQSGVPYYFKKI